MTQSRPSAPFLVDEIFDIICRINAETKVAVLLVDRMPRRRSRSRLCISGRERSIVMNGAAEVLRANPDIDAAYLGGGKSD